MLIATLQMISWKLNGWSKWFYARDFHRRVAEDAEVFI
jgi:hypothetical protein